MRRLFRLLAASVAAALLVSGTLTAVAALGASAVHQVASAQDLPLPPMDSRISVPTHVYAADGKTLLATLKGPEFRKPVKLSQVSKTMVTAVLDTEDHGFYVHGGFDIPSIVRAFVTDASGNGLQGGSTIPQQLVKQLYLSPTRKISRKIREAVLADRLVRQYSKNQILQAYLNTIYLGSGAYGVEAAAETYFSEPASRLDLAQSALLAGMIQDPNGYDPVLAPAAARDRRAVVLGRMAVLKDITPAQEAAANATPLPTNLAGSLRTTVVQQDPIAGYYVNQVKLLLLDESTVLGTTPAEREDALFNGGLRIVTNLDPSMQTAAEQAVANDTPRNNGGFEEGLVSIDPTNGAVRALVGGAGTNVSQFDIMTQGGRQPGSGFKLFTLLAALQQGYSVYDTLDGTGPCAILFPGNTSLAANPIKNDTTTEGGIQPLIKATANSVNCAFIRLGHEVGLPAVVSMAQSLGISPTELPHKKFDYIPSVIIGAATVHPIEMAGAYAAVADGGVYHPPSFIDTISDRTGTVIFHGLANGRRVVSTQVAAEADVALQAVVTSGTGTAAELYGRPVAGKTGTTNNNVDAWFNGFTPQLETTVWMGNLQYEVPIYIYGQPVYGANYPAETWHDYSSAVLSGQPVIDFPAVDPALLPPTKFITSPSLVADDILDHNGGGSTPYYTPYYTPYQGSYPPTTPAPGPAPTTATTTPSTTPPSPPTTKKGKH